MSAVQFQIRPFYKNASQTEYIALNQHLAQFEIMVVSECRRMGLGRQLLRPIAEAAQQENRRLLTTSTVDRIPGGEAFMLRLGAQKGQASPFLAISIGYDIGYDLLPIKCCLGLVHGQHASCIKC